MRLWKYCLFSTAGVIVNEVYIAHFFHRLLTLLCS